MVDHLLSMCKVLGSIPTPPFLSISLFLSLALKKVGLLLILNKIRVFLFGNNHNRKDDQGIKKNKHETDKSYFCLQSWLQISKLGGEQPLC